MDIITPQQINRILSITDKLGIHREAITIPLGTESAGDVSLTKANKIEIVAPVSEFDAWLGILPARIRELDLSRVKRADA